MFAQTQQTETPRHRAHALPAPCGVSDFNRRLAERFGSNRFGGPNFKCVWGDSEREFKPDGRFGLKYFRAWGQRTLRSLTTTPAGLKVPTFDRPELGIARFIVERFVDPEKLPRADQARYPRGRYVFFYEVETTLARDSTQGLYRPPGEDTLDHVAAILAGEEEAQRQLDRDLARMVAEDDRDVERNASGENKPFNQVGTAQP